ncbi:MAG TPA: 1-deoxy-D-xylulose-5-phosphate synthase [Marinilabiliales bacterium]|jgi:1-deoxy-D-xylulose-5-phosphate synthase|nr:1-deoxy-D-xylulose-5-phosphate synthase [Marinilabiliales bacterium]
MGSGAGKILSSINSPDDLKKLSNQELVALCDELRQFIIDVVCEHPGHFGASLGVVELSVALHYVFNTPYDQVVWDVGHQAYGHKILTGRRDKFRTNRRLNGISGFPNRFESLYDAFGVGHSSTSISAALGLAVASKLKKEKDRQVVAVIGDGAITGGLAFEGLNNAGVQKSNLLVILNDNNMAIDPNVGAFKEYLVDIATSQAYNKLKDDVWNVLGKLNRFGPNTQALIQKIDHGIKAILMKQGNFFESMNFRYFGPVDGHDVVYLTKVLDDLRKIPGPKLLHIKTVKGKGFKQAELDQTTWHAPGPFDKNTGKLITSESDEPIPPRFQDVFGHTLLELAQQNEKIVGITPAMPTGCSLNIMMAAMPERTFDVGIAEQHAVTFSAGLAAQGLVPFCNIYSTFMQRAYDQVIHDVALQKLNVVFCLDRGGLVGADGPTHHGAYDIAYMRNIPNMIIAAPMDEIELRNMMFTAQQNNMGPFSIRYPRGRGIITDWKQPFETITVGKARKLHSGKGLAILTIGNTGLFVAQLANELAEANIEYAHYDMRFVKPIDEAILHEIFAVYDKVLTVEDGALMGGFGSAILEFMADNNYQTAIKRLGIPDIFVEQGSPEELHALCGYGPQGILNTVLQWVEPAKNKKLAVTVTTNLDFL